MTYWHLQMNQPYGERGEKLQSVEMLKLDKPVIGTSDGQDIQFKYFNGEDARGIRINDIVLVREGKKIIALCKVIGEYFQDSELNTRFHHEIYRHVDVLQIYDKVEDFPQAQGKLQRLINLSHSYQIVDNLYKSYLKLSKMNNLTYILKSKKQIILQGAPGTGKTYKTAEIALGIMNRLPSDFTNRESLMIEYRKAVADGLIFFTTFHQSMDYEEFVEGLKPLTNDKKEIYYEVKNGIFKSICKKAIEKNTTKSFDEVYAKFIDDLESVGSINLKTPSQERVFTVRKNQNNSCVARADFENSTDSVLTKERIQHFIETGEIPFYKPYATSISEYLKEKYDFKVLETDNSQKNYVLIIDEINRGNVSKILGELITLLEADKRSGNTNAVTVKLPYSNETFSVPDNVYIIGTMNTADRSLGHIDYAVRRRFAFVTLRADVEAIKQFYQNNEILKNIALDKFSKVEKILENISPDFESEDLMIGHSYFMAKDESELKMKMEYEVIPLLHEYRKDGILNTTKVDLDEKIKTLL